ncbi:MAG: Maf family protein [Pseudomonadota bacterium]
MNQNVIFLASGSPRRRELLTQIGVTFECLVTDVDESVLENEAPSDLVQRLSLLKSSAAQTVLGPSPVIIGADTTVAIEGQMFGKPTDREDALHMMARLSGKVHKVFTGVTVMRGDWQKTLVQISRVTMRETSLEERGRYWDNGEPRDKAGAYGVQGLGAVFVQRIEGSYSGVMGLPLCETAGLLAEVGCGPL